jgi:hypothetical protein
MKKIRSVIQEYILKSKTKKTKHIKEFLSFDEIKNVIVFCDATVDIAELVKFSNLLSSHNIYCTLLSYRPKLRIEDTKPSFVYVRDMDITIKGDFLDNSLNNLYSCDYEVCFDFREKNDIISDYLATRIKSNFIVGCNKNLKGLDFVISTEGDISAFKEASIEFLKKLKKS